MSGKLGGSLSGHIVCLMMSFTCAMCRTKRSVMRAGPWVLPCESRASVHSFRRWKWGFCLLCKHIVHSWCRYVTGRSYRRAFALNLFYKQNINMIGFLVTYILKLVFLQRPALIYCWFIFKFFSLVCLFFLSLCFLMLSPSFYFLPAE